jgi:serine O-acetyltransferase
MARKKKTDGRKDSALERVVDILCASEHGKLRYDGRGLRLPSRERVIEAVEGLRAVLFPGYFGSSELWPESIHFQVGATLDRVLKILGEQVHLGLCFRCGNYGIDCPECADRSQVVIDSFLAGLPRVQHTLATDVQSAFEGDPAASSLDEAIFCYPGILAVTSYRLAHLLYTLSVPLIPRMITEHAHSLTGIDIHPGAEIGENFFIDHGTGVVIGETSRIGRGVRIYQGVTLGAKSFPLDNQGRPVKGVPRHPIVEDDVIIYSGATILGRVTLGRGAVIGGNVWITEDVAAGSHITQSTLPGDPTL